jgi:hypothetical protein
MFEFVTQIDDGDDKIDDGDDTSAGSIGLKRRVTRGPAGADRVLALVILVRSSSIVDAQR